MSKKHILVVEDERDMAELIATRLKREGYVVEHAFDGEEALRKIRSNRPDLVLLDLFLPKLSGLDVLREIRQDPRASGVPVIVVTAKGDEADVIVGLQLGADDYIPKPFNSSMLVARIDAVLRRSVRSTSGQGPMALGSLLVDPERYIVEVDHKEVTLTPTEFRLLLALVSARGRILTRNQLIDQAIGQEAIVSDRTVDVHLTSMRRKLGHAQSYIKTIRGIGYRLAAEGADETA